MKDVPFYAAEQVQRLHNFPYQYRNTMAHAALPCDTYVRKIRRGRSKDTAAGERGELFRRARTVAWSFSRNTLPLRDSPLLPACPPSPSLSFLGTLSLSRVLSRCSGRSPGVPCHATASAICVENAAQLARFGPTKDSTFATVVVRGRERTNKSTRERTSKAPAYLVSLRESQLEIAVVSGCTEP